MAAIFKKYDVRLVQEHSGLYDLDKKISRPQAADICKNYMTYELHMKNGDVNVKHQTR